MALRRSVLKELALEYHSIFEEECFTLDSTRNPDYHADQIVEILEKHNIDIPGSLKLCTSTEEASSRREYSNSVYGALHYAWQANLFWGLGFRDTNYPSPDGRTSLLYDAPYACLDNPDYLYWLLQHGADPFMKLSPRPGMDQNKQLSWCGPARMKHAYWTHLLFGQAGWELGKQLDSYLERRLCLNFVEATRKINIQFSDLKLADDCCCKCSTDGCTLQVDQLKSFMLYDSKRNGLDRSVFLSRKVRRYYELLWMAMPYHSHHDTIRFLTFKALGATHTCCGVGSEQSDLPLDPEKRELVQDEDSHLLEILETLVTEFDCQFYAILDAQPDNHAQLAGLWVVHWLPRMQEVLEELNTTDLPEDVKRKTEEMGVVWHGPERPPVPEDTAVKSSWDYWFGELDKIVGKT
ncbi:hypothetical protein PG984_015495 [Apiospora sp. TS-2023a]